MSPVPANAHCNLCPLLIGSTLFSHTPDGIVLCVCVGDAQIMWVFVFLPTPAMEGRCPWFCRWVPLPSSVSPARTLTNEERNGHHGLATMGRPCLATNYASYSSLWWRRSSVRILIKTAVVFFFCFLKTFWDLYPLVNVATSTVKNTSGFMQKEARRKKQAESYV